MNMLPGVRRRCALLVVALTFLVVTTAGAAEAEPRFTRVTTFARGMLKPAGVAVDPDTGSVYVADTNNHQIKVIRPDGNVLILAGSGVPGLEDGRGAVAQFHGPTAVVFDRTRKLLFIADRHNHVIRQITPDGVVTRIAGTGKRGFVDGSALAAQFDQPAALAIADDGSLYVADAANHVIRSLGTDGIVYTIAGTGRAGNADGPSRAARFAMPEGVAVRADGAVFVADTANHRVRMISGGDVTTVSGSGAGYVDGTAAASEFREPRGIAFDDDGNLFISDSGNGTVRMLSASLATVGTIAGSPAWRNTPQPVDGPVSTAALNEPAGVAFAGALFVADAKHDAVRFIEPRLVVTSVAPNRGPAGGGNTVRVLGVGFVPLALKVAFATTESAAVEYVASNELRVVAPAGTRTVAVTVSAGQSTAVAESAYTYVSPPSIHALTPARGPSAGGHVVTIDGAEFIDGGTEVLFGSTPASAVRFLDRTRMEAVAPPHAAGVVEVTVRTDAGEATATYEFVAAPAILAFHPLAGRSGATVTIHGNAFQAAPEENHVRFGNSAALVVAATPTQIVTTVPEGAQSGPISVTTLGGTSISATPFIVVRFTSIALVPDAASIEVGATLRLRAVAKRTDGSEADVTAEVNWESSDGDVVAVAAGTATGIAAGSATVTATFETLSASATIRVTSPEPLPPDPSTIAPNVDRTRVVTLHETVRFLYDGATPIQTNVAPNAIEPRRIAVVRGSLRSASGVPLPGVKVTVPGAPELGSTLSRADGVFDLVVNGGGIVRLRFERNGYLTADRTIALKWEQQRTLDPVHLLQYDQNATEIVSGAATVQVARGSVSSDADGSRRATLVFKSGTTAELVFADGRRQPLDRLSVRATEYTVGPDGRKAMPAPLPPQTSYTYCVELSADEAVNAGAASVEFSSAVSVYVENFRGLRNGEIMPSGYYDRAAGIWVAAPNGRILTVVGVANGMANVDADGNGSADTSSALDSLGITTEERQQLALLYAPGQSLWRVPVTHFTPWDYNLMSALAAGVPLAPNVPPPSSMPRVNDSCRVSGYSTIECENATLSEEIPITGTPFALEYNSGRAARSQYELTVPLTGDALPHGDLKVVHLNIEIAGQRHDWYYNAQPNLEQKFTWDGNDAYGRPVQGSAEALVTVEYAYTGVYLAAAQLPFAFARPSTRMVAIGPLPEGTTFPISSSWSVSLGRFDPAPTGFGGWTFSAMTLFDFRGQLLYLPGAVTRGVDGPQGTMSLSDAAGTGDYGSTGDGGAAVDAKLAYPTAVAMAADGSMYIATTTRIRKVDPSGTISTIAGTGVRGFSGDGGAATAAQIDTWDVALAPDGVTLYLSDGGDRIRRIDRHGMITTIAGTGTSGYTGDGGPATAASIRVEAMALAPDGSLYIAGTRTVRRIGIDGIITTVAGSLTAVSPGDGGLATNARLSTAVGIAIGPDGSLYVADATDDTVRRVTPDGRIHTVAGLRGGEAYVIDGELATSGRLDTPWGVAVSADGTVVFAELGTYKVRAIRPDGRIITIAGNGVRGRASRLQGVLARGTVLEEVYDVEVGPDGHVYVADASANRIRRVHTALPNDYGARTGTLALAAGNTDAAFRFESGRHVQTIDRLTGAAVQTLTYDDDGLVVGVADVDGLVTRIERNAEGHPVAIIAPGGQRTTLAVNAEGRLASVSNPAAETYTFSYDANALLSKLVDPRMGVHEFVYDESGRLRKDTDPAGGFVSLSIVREGTDFLVNRQTPEGLSFFYRVRSTGSGTLEREITRPDGLKGTISLNADGTTQSSAPDGTSLSLTRGPDPGFGMQSGQLSSATLTTPLGIQMDVKHDREVTFANRRDPFSLVSRRDTTTLNSRAWVTTYTAATRTAITRSPMGRETSTTFDANGRVLKMTAPGFAATEFTYDSRGRLETVKSGTRTVGYGYNSRDELTAVKNAVLGETSMTYDDAGRLTVVMMPGERSMGLTYDAMGNVTSVHPPSRPAHAFTYTPVNLVETAIAPDGDTMLKYDSDRRIEQLTYPGGAVVTLTYDSAGRFETLQVPEGEYRQTYSLATGHVAGASAPGGELLTYVTDGALMKEVRWSGTVTGSVAYAYDPHFRLASENGANYAYDDDSLPTRAGFLSLARDAATGVLTGSSLGIVVEIYSYNEHGEVATRRAAAGPTVLFEVAYTRDDAGRIRSLTEAIEGASVMREFGYDAVGRLETVTRDGVRVAEYQYDGAGNRQQHTYTGGSDDATYDVSDRVVRYGDATFTYAPTGALATKTVGGVTTEFTYDLAANLRKVAAPNHTIEYVIDAQNRRVGKKVNGVLSQGWLYADETRIVAELDGTGSVVATFVYGTRPNVPEYMVRGGITYRIISDHLGSPRLIVNAADGSVFQRMEFDEFGRTIADSNPGFQPFGFAGGLYDRDTGLVRFGARDYEPQTGRWTSKDPSGFAGGPNLYAYAYSDPVNFVDPAGDVPIIVAIIGVGAVVGGVSEAIGAYGSGGDAGDVAAAFGRGAVAGAAGALVGAAVAIHTGNPFLVGASAGVANEFTKQLLTHGGTCWDSNALVAAAAVGGFTGSFVAGLPAGSAGQGLRNAGGPMPNVWRNRRVRDYGPNAVRWLKQEAFGGGVGNALQYGATQVVGPCVCN